MTNQQAKLNELQARLADAFSHLEIEEMGFDYYINLIAQAMIKEICFEAGRTGAITELYEGKQHDYCKILDFLHTLKPLADAQEEQNARCVAYAHPSE